MPKFAVGDRVQRIGPLISYFMNRILIQVKSSDRLAALKLAEQVTVAIGVCEYGRGSSIDQFMKRAAEALSRAKSGNDDDGLTFVRAR